MNGSDGGGSLYIMLRLREWIFFGRLLKLQLEVYDIVSQMHFKEGPRVKQIEAL